MAAVPAHERARRPDRRPAGAGERSLVLYDADCGFCMWLLARLLRWDRARLLQPLALQRPEAGELLAPLAPAERMASWHLIAPGGERRSAGAALAPLLRLLPGGRAAAAAFARFPASAERGYRWSAEHRATLSKLIPAGAKRRAGERVRGRERALGAPTPTAAGPTPTAASMAGGGPAGSDAVRDGA
jgi:predicted DCC family thiol-disulfide oxidoreductase YuxK